MKRVLVIVSMLAAGLAFAADKKDVATQKDQEKFNGSWKAVSAEYDGKELPKEVVDKISIILKGNEYTVGDGDMVEKGTYKLDANKTPKTIDVVPSDGPDKDKPLLGIYELNDDTYKACFAPPGGERPTEFVTKPDSKYRLVVMKRASLKPLKSKPGATLKGKVTLKGNPPDIAALNAKYQQAIKSKPDSLTTCFDLAPEAEKTQPYWHIGAGNGISDVVVWIQPPEGYYFEVDTANKTWPEKVELSQPHCTYIPHINWAMPMIPDADNPKKMVPSGQKFLVSNLAAISHNTKWKSDAGPSNSSELGVLPAGTKPKDVSLKSGKDPGLVHFSCNIHPWMDAYVWVFDHPYAAVTDKDGNYEIKDVPIGSKVRVVAWHEKVNYLAPGMKKGAEIELKDGVNEENFEIELKEQ